MTTKTKTSTKSITFTKTTTRTKNISSYINLNLSTLTSACNKGHVYIQMIQYYESQHSSV